MNKYLLVLIKGFLMGAADIVPGISGGTVAFVAGIYQRLINAISSVDKIFIKLLVKLKIKEAFNHIDGKFLVVLLTGILSAIVIMSRAIHYCLNYFPTYTWSLFFGIILGTIFIMARGIEGGVKPYIAMAFGILLGNFVVTLTPIEPSHSMISIFISAMIAICAMLLPGISGAFILLILGKYEFITGVLKTPFAGDHYLIIIIFVLGALCGLLLFSKFLKYLLTNFENSVFSFLVGIMMASLIKIWPWKEAIETKVIRGKVHILKEQVFFPTDLSMEQILCFFIIILSCVLMIFSEKYVNKNKELRGLSSAG